MRNWEKYCGSYPEPITMNELNVIQIENVLEFAPVSRQISLSRHLDKILGLEIRYKKRHIPFMSAIPSTTQIGEFKPVLRVTQDLNAAKISDFWPQSSDWRMQLRNYALEAVWFKTDYDFLTVFYTMVNKGPFNCDPQEVMPSKFLSLKPKLRDLHDDRDELLNKGPSQIFAVIVDAHSDPSNHSA